MSIDGDFGEAGSDAFVFCHGLGYKISMTRKIKGRVFSADLIGEIWRRLGERSRRVSKAPFSRRWDSGATTPLLRLTIATH